ncbi:ABC transporter ATP-binding protein [Sphingobium sp. YR768]|uniref:ABC transporter ATP-binding protein n=1 Tax=Sphingobium sp. YR768 TaxID=1884365 RepID=UPI0008CB4CC2|nr:ABC transporter ATP-binding protein [Sphingobium sp. YR768]SER25647.1 iron complex transport system ATP-binding protein [Sphingobium sp. YR768]
MTTDTHDDSAILRGDGLTLRYEAREITRNLDIIIPTGRITIIVGPNACGKSTLLRALSRLLSPSSGHVFLHGRDLRDWKARDLARTIALLPQSSIAPQGISVADLVARGRYPHQSLLRQWSLDDERAVEAAMADTRISDLANRPVDALSGGQHQRVRLAMTLAQDTPLILLDEPTTYLDIAHQMELLDLCRHLNRTKGRTLVLVLHDLNLAARYADNMIAMKAGAIVASGTPTDVLTRERIAQVFSMDSLVMPDPVTGAPMVVPVSSQTGVFA